MAATRGRAYLFLSFLVPLWLIAGIGVAEIAFRVYVRPPRQIITHDVKLGWRYLPNVNAVTKDGGKLTTNSRGFRGKELDAPQATGLKILALGDSYTAGMHVADGDIFTSQLEQLLNRRQSTTIRNGAAPAWATDQELLYFETEGKDFRPDTVLLVVVPNDIREAYGKKFFALDEHGTLKDGSGAVYFSAPDRLFWTLLNQSALVQWLGDKFGFLDAFAILRRYYNFSFPTNGREATDYDLFLKEEPRELQNARHLFEALVLRLRDDTKALNARLVVTVLPTLMEFSWPLIGSKEHEAGLVSKRVQAFATRQKIDFIDLVSPALAMAGDARSLFLDGDFHLNPRGHRFVAEHLAAALAPVRKISK